MIRGKGNSYSFFYNGITKKEGLNYDYGKLDHYKKFKNCSNKIIKKGMACCFEKDTNEIRIMNSKDFLKMFAGIAAESIRNYEFGYLQSCGEISQDDILIKNSRGYSEERLGISNSDEGIFDDVKENILLGYVKKMGVGR